MMKMQSPSTDKFLNSLLYKLNHNKTRGLIHLRPLSETVDYGKVWIDQPRPTDDIDLFGYPFNFYFIKNNQGIYVATVLDMTRNLHWFVLPRFRQQDHLTKALKETILFHIFQDREEQKITIDENISRYKTFLASKKVAINVGFEKTYSNKNEYILTKDKYKTDKYFNGLNTELSEERIEDIKKRINFIYRSLWLVQTEIEMKLGNIDYADELKELTDEVFKHIRRFENACKKG